MWHKVVCPCGAEFMGGPTAKYCPPCRRDQKVIDNKAHRVRKRRGLSRVMGQLYTCDKCGGDYVLDGTLQRYCKKCVPVIYPEAGRKCSRAYYRDNNATINSKRRDTRTPKPRRNTAPYYWTEAEIARVFALLAGGKTHKQCGAIFGCTRRAITLLLMRLRRKELAKK